MSDKDKNKLVYTFLAIIVAVSFGLYWLFGGTEKAGNPVFPALSDVSQTEEAPPADLPVVEEEVILPDLIIEPEPTKPIKTPLSDSGETGEKIEVEPRPAGESVPQTLNLSVPFTSQAPLARWSDKRQQDGCEEAAVLMAIAWAKGDKGVSAATWEEKIITLADWEQEKYGEHRDVSVSDTVDWMFKDYFSYDKVSIKTIKNSAEIVAELEKGNLVLMPMNGRLLNNPNFTAPGPEHHFIVVKGYDYNKKEFITNDPGTRLGADYHYPEEVVFQALRAYPTGYHGSYSDIRKEAIIVSQ